MVIKSEMSGRKIWIYRICIILLIIALVGSSLSLYHCKEKLNFIQNNIDDKFLYYYENFVSGIYCKDKGNPYSEEIALEMNRRIDLANAVFNQTTYFQREKFSELFVTLYAYCKTGEISSVMTTEIQYNLMEMIVRPDEKTAEEILKKIEK